MSTSVGNQEEFVSALIIAFSTPSVKEALEDALAESIRRNVAQGISDATEHLRNDITLLRKELRERDQKIADLDKRISDLEVKSDQQEQYSRRTSVRISGIPEEEGENVLAKVKDTLSLIGVDPVVQRCHRVRAPARKKTANDNNSESDAGMSAHAVPSKPRQILVQFTGQRDKLDVMQKKKDSKALDDKKIYINEDLTRPRARLLYLARQLKRQKKLKGAWSADGRILVMNNRGDVRSVVSENDLNTL